MKEVAKYCPVCQQNFTEKFSFCPNCAAVLSLKKDEPEFFNVTLVEEKGSKTRHFFLLGATFLVMSGAILSLIGSIYNADAYVNALDDSLIYLASISDENAAKFEESELPEVKNENTGGSGTGGDKNPNPISKGDYASQSDKPLIAPSVTMNRLTKPEIPIIMETKGAIKRPLTDQPYGDKNSQYNIASDGLGENGGQGVGPDRGQGPEKGEGAGPGNPGPGSGLGPGGISGPKKAKLDEEDEKNNRPPKLNEPVGETVGIKILDKPRAIYTNDARKNQRAGTVTLRVTFMANGSVGNITVVSGLPDGLTENAIAAAKNIRFEPAKRNGVAQTVTKQVQYTFTLY
jgi:TonB family protein